MLVVGRLQKNQKRTSTVKIGLRLSKTAIYCQKRTIIIKWKGFVVYVLNKH
jgi:hypothetical protein